MDFTNSLFKNVKNIISLNNLIYGIFPVILLIILYGAFFPFNQGYIGEWHEILSNSMQFSILNENYFTTWNNMWAGGFPIIASPGSDKYYLFSAPIYQIFQNFSVINYVILFHIIIAYFSFFKLGSLISKNNNLLMLGATTFAFSGIFFGRLGQGGHLLFYGLVWIPLLYYFFLKITIFDEATITNAILLSIVSILIYSTGDIYHFTFAYIVIFIFFIYYAINHKISKKILGYLILSLFITTLVISIKSIPDLGVSNLINRIDPINPFEGGGSIENDISSFVTGHPIDTRYSKGESTVMIGVIPILLAIIGLIYGKKEITIPAYFTILFSMVWAAGGKTIVSIIHIAPLVNNFRVPGRFFGVLLPITFILSLYGIIVLYQKFKTNEPFELSKEQKRHLIYGTIGIIILKVLELPYQEQITVTAAIPVITICVFIALLYSQKGSFKNISLFFISAIIVNTILLLNDNDIPSNDNLIKLGFISIILASVFLYIKISKKKNIQNQMLCAILIIGIFITILGNINFITTYTPPFENSPAIDVIKEIKNQPAENIQIWVLETGWHIQHMDFTYWDIINKIHPANIYLPYYLKTTLPVSYKIGDINYYTVDYIVDTKYLENGNQNLAEVTFKVRNISVYKPEHVLPNVFYVRNEQVYPLTIDKFTSEEVIASGNLLPGDVVVLKGSYYPGWKVNGNNAESVGNMIGSKLTVGTKQIRFNFDPLDYKLGAILSACGCILIIVGIIKRKKIDGYIQKVTEPIVMIKKKKKHK